MNSLLAPHASRPTHQAICLGLLVALFGAGVAHAQPGPGFALSFNDNASYVAVPQAVGLNSFPFTVMAWVNTSAGTGQQGLVNKYVANSLNGWNLFLKDGHASVH